MFRYFLYPFKKSYSFIRNNLLCCDRRILEMSDNDENDIENDNYNDNENENDNENDNEKENDIENENENNQN